MLSSSDYPKESQKVEQSPALESWLLSKALPQPLVTKDFNAPSNPLITKLQNFVSLTHTNVDVLEKLCRNSRTYGAEQNIIQEATASGFVCVILSGLAYRYKMLQNGHRQILGFLIPGDICDLSFTVCDYADYSVSTLIESRIVKLPTPQLRETLARNPEVRRAFDLAAHLDCVILRQWLVNIGQRKAHQKLSYFLFEMTRRLGAIGETNEDGWIDFPLIQPILADTIGATTVHVNRTLQRLRRDGVIALSGRRLKILDAQRLITIANWEGNYLESVNQRRVVGAHENAGDGSRRAA